jgi:YfiH family protein
VAGTLRLSAEGILSVPGLADAGGLVHGFSTTALGSMRGDRDRVLTAPRRAFLEALGLPGERLSVLGAVHGSRVGKVDGPSGVVRGCDALVTDRPWLPLLATLADCYPVLLFDPGRPALGLVHAGWRGAAAGIVGEALARLRQEYGSEPAEVVAALGPGICGECYEVGPEVASRFPPEFVQPSLSSRFLLDLRSALRAQLLAAGVHAGRVHYLALCTRETPELPSHRRSPDGARFACLAALT